jgi:hypothetical protein
MSSSPKLNRGIVVFSGGSAANSLVDVFNTVRENKNCSLSYIIPISDNGGSSSELIRVFGGPGIGDVRSLSPSYCPTACSSNIDPQAVSSALSPNPLNHPNGPPSKPSSTIVSQAPPPPSPCQNGTKLSTVHPNSGQASPPPKKNSSAPSLIS